MMDTRGQEGREASSRTSTPESDSPRYGPRLWQIQAVRDAIPIVAAVLGAWLVYILLDAIAPVLFGFAGAYFIAPVVRWLEHRGIGRVFVTTLTSIVSLVAAVAVLVTLVPRVVKETRALRASIPEYVRVIREQTGLDPSDFWAMLDLESALGAIDRVRPLMGFLGSVLGSTAYGFLFIVLTATSFVVFNLNFENLPNIVVYLPKSHRAKLQPSAELIAGVFQGFLRGQLLVMIFTTMVYTAGFALLGVPHGVVAGLIGGLLSILPYGQVSGPLLAILFNGLEGLVHRDFDFLSVFVPPAIVYVVMQALESLVVTPLVQGAATRLHPLAILVCLAAGGSVGGFLGVFLAIPITASVWMLSQKHIFPAWREWAEQT